MATCPSATTSKAPCVDAALKVATASLAAAAAGNNRFLPRAAMLTRPAAVEVGAAAATFPTTAAAESDRLLQ